MNTYLALLRGINLGNRRLKMDRLRALFEELRFAKVATFIASGNVIFESKETESLKLEQKIEKHLEAALGYDVDVFLRTREEVNGVVASQAFSEVEMAAPENTVHVGFLKRALNPDISRELVVCRTEVDELRVIGREYYWLCRIKMSESKVWASPKMRALKLPTSTMRNMTTVKKLAALLDAK